ncbi:hypothetical protein CCP2SC5_210037 [Azospirillaceae bacterium]
MEMIAEICNWEGKLLCDVFEPDGMPRKALDASRLLNMGWRPSVGSAEGLARTYAWFLEGNDVRLR